MQKKFLLFLMPAMFLPVFLLPLMLLPTGCGKAPKSLSDIKDATPADSMMYYFGEMQAANYWQDAETDTMLRSETARKEFMEGFRAAMEMEKSNEAYNKGLQLGLRLAIRLREFNARYGLDFSESILAASFENALKSDSEINLIEAQKGYYKIKDHLELNASVKEVAAAKKNLLEIGERRGFEMINDTLYVKDITPGMPGAHFKEGDRIAVEVTASTIDGKEIVARQFPDSLTLGEGRIPHIVTESIYTMTNGQTRQFMTTPRTLFGKRYAVYHLPYDEPVIFTVKAERK